VTLNVFIDGGVGTTGLEIRDRLAKRTGLALITLDEQHRKDANARATALNDADIVILCLPDDAAREAVASIRNAATRVIDASSTHRTDPAWTYGFAELEPDRRDALKAATRVSNPGCYPTGFLALIRPLVRAGLVPADWPFTVNAVSGYSGGGKAMIAAFEEPESPDATETAHRSYALTLAHKHLGEMQAHAGIAHVPIFSPAVARTYRGMLVEVPLLLAAMPNAPSVSAIRDELAASYAASPLVTIGDPDRGALEIEQRASDDRLELFVFANAAGDRVRLVAALDNLGKGAAGAAVQNLNLMAGFEETDGLRI
jgi:N-acetyl-gamma-glutamyl-phosphate reductase